MHHLRQITLCLSALAALSVSAVAVAQPISYTTTVQLASGKQVTCAVNQPHARAGDAAQISALTRSEINEAELAAIAPLRNVRVSKEAYPHPALAPHVQCG
ncbi:TPA: hypothetical protein QDC44_001930 [Burkholderia cepacia ATCC 25416]|nr:hypothetical protein [Burkholderia cepacia ATCC 25416]